MIRLGADKLIACGLSKRKTEYILDLAQHFVSGALHVDKWTSMDDEDVIAELTQIRGISRWTAEMFLIFNLSRPDVLPLDDPGLIRAISVNYFSGEPVTRSEARKLPPTGSRGVPSRLVRGAASMRRTPTPERRLSGFKHQ